jgi:hypothetical protein
MTDEKTDKELMRESWADVKQILRAYLDAGPQRDVEATIGKLRAALVNDKFNAVADRVERRRSFEVVGEPRTVWIYDNGKTEKFFDSELEALAWCAVNDPEGVAIKHQLGPVIPAGQADRHGLPKATE